MFNLLLIPLCYIYFLIDLTSAIGYDQLNRDSQLNNYPLQDFQIPHTNTLNVTDSLSDGNYSINQFNSQVNVMQKPVNFGKFNYISKRIKYYM